MKKTEEIDMNEFATMKRMNGTRYHPSTWIFGSQTKSPTMATDPIDKEAVQDMAVDVQNTLLLSPPGRNLTIDWSNPRRESKSTRPIREIRTVAIPISS
jgi:hypothetical protein